MRRRTVKDLLMQTPQPELTTACASIRVQENANKSMLPQRPYATHAPGFGWVIDSVCSTFADYNQVPGIYPVTVLPERYYQ